MASVISDSSPLISLSGINRLELLRDLFGKVIIPPAVWREVVTDGPNRTGDLALRKAQAAGWIEVEAPSAGALLSLLKWQLDPGEAEAIALALEKSAEQILLDEPAARRIADLYQLNKIGVVGILIRAKQNGQISLLKDELDNLRLNTKFRLADRLYEQALAAVGERP